MLAPNVVYPGSSVFLDRFWELTGFRNMDDDEGEVPALSSSSSSENSNSLF